MDCDILIIDGNSLLFKAFYGVPARIYGKDNKLIHGLFGFIGILLKTIISYHPTYLVLAFDNELGSFRDKIDGGYKSNRIRDWSGISEEKSPFSQLPKIYKALNYLKLKHYEILDYEADDVIAECVKRYGENNKIIILSTDYDLLQLVNDNAKLFFPRGKNSILYGVNEVKNKFGILPELIPEFKALVGDKSDNIKGIHGIGEKTAQKLFKQYSSLEEIYNKLDDIEPNSLRQKLLDNKERVFKNLNLIRLKERVDLPFDLECLKVPSNLVSQKTMQILRDIDLV